ncbi:uncharacterized protein [Bemisia tabaci]
MKKCKQTNEANRKENKFRDETICPSSLIKMRIAKKIISTEKPCAPFQEKSKSDWKTVATINRSNSTVRGNTTYSILSVSEATERQITNQPSTPIRSSLQLQDSVEIGSRKLQLLQEIKKLLLDDTSPNNKQLEEVSSQNLSGPVEKLSLNNSRKLPCTLKEGLEETSYNERTVNLTREMIDNTVNAFHVVTKLPFLMSGTGNDNSKTAFQTDLADDSIFSRIGSANEFSLKIFLNNLEVYNNLVTKDLFSRVVNKEQSSLKSETPTASKPKITTRSRSRNKLKLFPLGGVATRILKGYKKKKSKLEKFSNKIIPNTKGKLHCSESKRRGEQPSVLTDKFINDLNDFSDEITFQGNPSNSFTLRSLKWFHSVDEATKKDFDQRNYLRRKPLVLKRKKKLKGLPSAMGNHRNLCIAKSSKQPFILTNNSTFSLSDSNFSFNAPLFQVRSPSSLDQNYYDLDSDARSSPDPGLYRNSDAYSVKIVSKNSKDPTYCEPKITVPFSEASNNRNFSIPSQIPLPHDDLAQFSLDNADTEAKQNPEEYPLILGTNQKLAKSVVLNKFDPIIVGDSKNTHHFSPVKLMNKRDFDVRAVHPINNLSAPEGYDKMKSGFEPFSPESFYVKSQIAENSTDQKNLDSSSELIFFTSGISSTVSAVAAHFTAGNYTFANLMSNLDADSINLTTNAGLGMNKSSLSDITPNIRTTTPYLSSVSKANKFANNSINNVSVRNLSSTNSAKSQPASYLNLFNPKFRQCQTGKNLINESSSSMKPRKFLPVSLTQSRNLNLRSFVDGNISYVRNLNNSRTAPDVQYIDGGLATNESVLSINIELPSKKEVKIKFNDGLSTLTTTQAPNNAFSDISNLTVTESKNIPVNDTTNSILSKYNMKGNFLPSSVEQKDVSGLFKTDSTRSLSQFSKLSYGNISEMVTDHFFLINSGVYVIPSFFESLNDSLIFITHNDPSTIRISTNLHRLLDEKLQSQNSSINFIQNTTIFRIPVLVPNLSDVLSKKLDRINPSIANISTSQQPIKSNSMAVGLSRNFNKTENSSTSDLKNILLKSGNSSNVNESNNSNPSPISSKIDSNLNLLRHENVTSRKNSINRSSQSTAKSLVGISFFPSRSFATASSLINRKAVHSGLKTEVKSKMQFLTPLILLNMSSSTEAYLWNGSSENPSMKLPVETSTFNKVSPITLSFPENSSLPPAFEKPLVIRNNLSPPPQESETKTVSVSSNSSQDHNLECSVKLLMYNDTNLSHHEFYLMRGNQSDGLLFHDFIMLAQKNGTNSSFKPVFESLKSSATFSPVIQNISLLKFSSNHTPPSFLSNSNIPSIQSLNRTKNETISLPGRTNTPEVLAILDSKGSVSQLTDDVGKYAEIENSQVYVTKSSITHKNVSSQSNFNWTQEKGGKYFPSSTKVSENSLVSCLSPTMESVGIKRKPLSVDLVHHTESSSAATPNSITATHAFLSKGMSAKSVYGTAKLAEKCTPRSVSSSSNTYKILSNLTNYENLSTASFFNTSPSPAKTSKSFNDCMLKATSVNSNQSSNFFTTNTTRDFQWQMNGSKVKKYQNDERTSIMKNPGKSQVKEFVPVKEKSPKALPSNFPAKKNALSSNSVKSTTETVSFPKHTSSTTEFRSLSSARSMFNQINFTTNKISPLSTKKFINLNENKSKNEGTTDYQNLKILQQMNDDISEARSSNFSELTISDFTNSPLSSTNTSSENQLSNIQFESPNMELTQPELEDLNSVIDLNDLYNLQLDSNTLSEHVETTTLPYLSTNFIPESSIHVPSLSTRSKQSSNPSARSDCFSPVSNASFQTNFMQTSDSPNVVPIYRADRFLPVVDPQQIWMAPNKSLPNSQSNFDTYVSVAPSVRQLYSFRSQDYLPANAIRRANLDSDQNSLISNVRAAYQTTIKPHFMTEKLSSLQSSNVFTPYVTVRQNFQNSNRGQTFTSAQVTLFSQNNSQSNFFNVPSRFFVSNKIMSDHSRELVPMPETRISSVPQSVFENFSPTLQSFHGFPSTLADTMALPDSDQFASLRNLNSSHLGVKPIVFLFNAYKKNGSSHHNQSIEFSDLPASDVLKTISKNSKTPLLAVLKGYNRLTDTPLPMNSTVQNKLIGMRSANEVYSTERLIGNQREITGFKNPSKLESEQNLLSKQSPGLQMAPSMMHPNSGPATKAFNMAVPCENDSPFLSKSAFNSVPISKGAKSWFDNPLLDSSSGSMLKIDFAHTIEPPPLLLSYLIGPTKSVGYPTIVNPFSNGSTPVSCIIMPDMGNSQVGSVLPVNKWLLNSSFPSEPMNDAHTASSDWQTTSKVENNESPQIVSNRSFKLISIPQNDLHFKLCSEKNNKNPTILSESIVSQFNHLKALRNDIGEKPSKSHLSESQPYPFNKFLKTNEETDVESLCHLLNSSGSNFQNTDSFPNHSNKQDDEIDFRIGLHHDSLRNSQSPKSTRISKDDLDLDYTVRRKDPQSEFQPVQPPIFLWNSPSNSPSKIIFNSFPKIFYDSPKELSSQERFLGESPKVFALSPSLQVINPVFLLPNDDAITSAMRGQLEPTAYDPSVAYTKKQRKLSKFYQNVLPKKSDKEKSKSVIPWDFALSIPSNLTPNLKETALPGVGAAFFVEDSLKKSAFKNTSIDLTVSSEVNNANLGHKISDKIFKVINESGSETNHSPSTLNAMKSNMNQQSVTPVHFQVTAKIDLPDQKLGEKIHNTPVIIQVLIQNRTGPTKNPPFDHKSRVNFHKGMKSSHRKVHPCLTSNHHSFRHPRKKYGLHSRHYRSRDSGIEKLSHSTEEFPHSSAELNHGISKSAAQHGENNFSSGSLRREKQDFSNHHHLEAGQLRSKIFPQSLKKPISAQPLNHRHWHSAKANLRITPSNGSRNVVGHLQRKLKNYDSGKMLNNLFEYSDYDPWNWNSTSADLINSGSSEQLSPDWFILPNSSPTPRKNINPRWAQKPQEESVAPTKSSEFSAEDCKLAYGSKCVCDMSKVLTDYDTIICDEESTEEAKLRAILEYRCSSYLPLPAGYYIDKSTKSLPIDVTEQVAPENLNGSKEINAEVLSHLQRVDITSIGTSRLRYAFVGSKVEIPCYDNFQTPLPIKATDSIQYKWQKGKKVITEGRMKESPNGTLTIDSVVMMDTGIFFCIISFSSPEMKNQERIFNHTLSVVTVPKITIQAVIHFKTNARCKLEILQMFNSYIPPLIQESICEAGEKDNEICEIGVFHPLCLQNKTDSTIMSLNVQMNVRSIEDLIIHSYANKAVCGPVCHQKLYIKTSLILKESLQEALLTPILDATSISDTALTPLPSSFNMKMTVGCDAGFRLAENFCVPCPPHWFSPEGSTVCTKCPAGFYQPQIGSRACLRCPSPLTQGCNVIANVFNNHKKDGVNGSADAGVMPTESPSSGDTLRKILLILLSAAVLFTIVYYCVGAIIRIFSPRKSESFSSEKVPLQSGSKRGKKSKRKRSSSWKKKQEEIPLQDLGPSNFEDSDDISSYAETKFGPNVSTKRGEPQFQEEGNAFLNQCKNVKETARSCKRRKKWFPTFRSKRSKNHEYLELPEIRPLRKGNAPHRNAAVSDEVKRTVRTPERRRKEASAQPDFS